jgi:putative tricarboxylic transport membrane protein
MKWLHRLSSLSLMAFSVWVFLSSLRLGVGTPKEPGPGFMPLLAAVLIFSLSLWGFIRRFYGTPGKKARARDRSFFLKSGIFVATILLYALILEAAGFIVAGFLLLSAEFSITQPKQWPKNLAIAALVSILSFIVFRRLLGVQLPRGIFSI